MHVQRKNEIKILTNSTHKKRNEEVVRMMTFYNLTVHAVCLPIIFPHRHQDFKLLACCPLYCKQIG